MPRFKMSTILAGAWLNVRKKEPEPLKEEQVIEIVQQALEHPGANTTVRSSSRPEEKKLTGRKKENTVAPVPASQKESNTADDGNIVEAAAASSQQGTKTAVQGTIVDPKVAEFFKDFPEPYREKAIQRFSQRDGWYRWDFIRDYMMQHELSFALNQGIFLEDKREEQERSAKQEKEKREEELEAYVKRRKEGDVKDWEKKLMEFMPVAEEESPGWKLVTVVSFVMLSGLCLHQAAQLRRQVSGSTGRWKAYRQIAFYLGYAGVFGVGGVCRFMDYGIFDRSVDNRDILTRAQDDIERDFQKLKDYLDGKNK